MVNETSLKFVKLLTLEQPNTPSPHTSMRLKAGTKCVVVGSMPGYGTGFTDELP